MDDAMDEGIIGSMISALYLMDDGTHEGMMGRIKAILWVMTSTKLNICMRFLWEKYVDLATHLTFKIHHYIFNVNMLPIMKFWKCSRYLTGFLP